MSFEEQFFYLLIGGILLETYFESIELSKEPLKLNIGNTITNVGLFIDSHFKTIKSNNGIRLSYLI